MTQLTHTRAADVVARCLRRVPVGKRSAFLRELMAHAAAGLTVIHGAEEAAGSTYRLADALVARRGRHG